MVTSEMFFTLKLSGNLKKRLAQLKKFTEEELEKSKTKEKRTFLKYMICYHLLQNHYRPKVNLSEQYINIHQKCECATYEELKSIWKAIASFPWRD